MSNPTGINQYSKGRSAAKAMRATISKSERSRPSSRKRIADALRTVRKGGIANQAGRTFGK